MLHVPHLRLRAAARACDDVAADRSRCRTLASGVQVSAPLDDHRTCTRLLLRCCSSETHFHLNRDRECHDCMTGGISSASSTTSGCISALSPSLSPSTFPVTPSQGLVLPFLDLSHSYPSISVSFELSHMRVGTIGSMRFPTFPRSLGVGPAGVGTSVRC